ncbi:MAG: cell division protein FtsL [Gammaproteobacteria bacterium]|nr:cell division protein FtsL [Gammaproteobacteria bacterium]
MRREVLLPVLLVAVVASALSVVYVKHEARKQFVVLQSLERDRDQMQIQWGRLQIEEGALSSVDRVRATARQHLDLVKPTLAQTVLVQK